MREIDGVPVYKITIDEEYAENGEELGIDMIAFTSNPAIKTKGLAFKSQVKPQAFMDDLKMRIAAPAMIPMDIYRFDDEDGEYYVEFTEEEIEKMYSKFMNQLSNRDIFNLEHDAEKKVPAYVLETLLVDSKPKQKMVKDEYSVEVPLGSVFVVSQITDKDYYHSLVENGQIGYSIEGFLGLKLSEIKNKNKSMENPRYELDGKFYEVIDGKLSEVAEEVTEEVAEVTEEVALEETPELVEEVALEDNVEDEEEEKEEMAEEAEEEEKEELAVDPELDAEAVLAIVTPVLEDFKKDVLQILGEMQNEAEVEEEVEEVEMAKLSVSQRFGAIREMFKDINY